MNGDRGVSALLVLLAFTAGLLLSSYVMPAEPPAATVTKTVTVAPPATMATKTVTTTRVENNTVTVTRTVPSTVTVKSVVTVTETKTVTETVTETRTYTVTVVETVTAVKLESQPRTPHGDGYLDVLASPPAMEVTLSGGTPWLRIYSGDGILVIEKNVSRINCYMETEQIIYDYDYGHSLYLALAELLSGDYVTAVYARAEPGRYLAVYNLTEILEHIPPGRYTFYDYSTGTSCSITLDEHGVSVASCTTGEGEACPASSSGYDSIIAALASLDEAEVSLVASAAMPGWAPRTPAEAAWGILEYMDERFTYDYNKMGYANAKIYSPLEFLSKGSGVCSDYAVFGAAMLLNATGVGYVITLDTPAGPHAVAAAGIANRLYVLDQHLPVEELQDYLEYTAPGSTNLRLYKVSLPGPVVEVFRIDDTSIIDDGYPSDRLDDPSAVEEARRILAEKLGLRPYPGLEAFIDPLKWGAWYQPGLPRLGGAVGRTAKKVPFDAVYTPVFREQWARLIAGYAELLHQEYYSSVPEGSGYSMWMTVGRRDNGFYIYYIAARAPPVNASLTMAGGKATYTFDLPPGVDPVRDISIAVYAPGKHAPCAGVTPPGYYYTNMPYVEAETWKLVGGRLVVVFDYRRLVEASRGCGSPLALVLWIGDAYADARLIG